MSAKTSFIPLQIALLTISDTRTQADDRSGALLASSITAAGHQLFAQQIVADHIYQIRAIVSAWIANPEVQVIISSGGTGVTGRDGTPEAVAPLLDKTLDGFGELFRMLSYQSIKSSTIQSRTLAGVANGTYIFCLPGSTNACQTAWDLLIQDQLDARTRPCNLVQLMPRLLEQ
jgi:molybdenum cofactor biosynthesis protein B